MQDTGSPAPSPVIPVAGDTVVTETAFGQAATAGVDADFSREDHTHGTPPAPVIPAAGDTVVTETTFGQASTAGIDAAFSRKDHTHGTPVAQVLPVAGDTVVTEIGFGQASTAGANAAFSRKDHTHGTPTDPVPGHVALPDPHTQYQLESEKGAVSGYASLNGSSLVAQNPANATATPTATKIPIADGAGHLNGWISLEPWVPGVSLDGSGAVIVAGSKGYRLVGDACIIQQWMILADAVGNITIDIKKCDYVGYPVTASICGGALPALAGVVKGESSALGAWSVNLASGDILEFVVSAPTVMTKAWLFLRVKRT